MIIICSTSIIWPKDMVFDSVDDFEFVGTLGNRLMFFTISPYGNEGFLSDGSIVWQQPG